MEFLVNMIMIILKIRVLGISLFICCNKIMDLKLNFLKECIDPKNVHLSSKTSRSKIKRENQTLSTQRSQKRETHKITHSRLYSSDSKTLFLQQLPVTRRKKDKLSKPKPTSSHFTSTEQSPQNCINKSLEILPNTGQTEVTKNTESKISPRTKSRELSLTEAASKIYEYNNKIWMQKHNSRNNAESLLINFANEFFKQLDVGGAGVVNGKHLVENLLSLGIATDSYVLRETLSLIFNCEDVYDANISAQDFIALFRRDVVADKILKVLNESALNERKKNKVLNQRVKNWKGTESESPLSFFKLKLTMSLAGHEQHELIKKSQDIITINEHLYIIEKLWKKFFKDGDDGISLLTACEAFKHFKIFQDNFECKKFIISSLGQANFLTYHDFEQLFAKSMIKGSFLNLSKRLGKGNFAAKEMSPGFRLGAYQRALLMSGIRCPNSNIPVEEGEKIVTALEKFKNFPKVTYEELRTKLLKLQGIDEKQAEKNEIRTMRNRKILNDIRSITGRLFSNTSKRNRQLTFKDGKVQFF